MGKLTALKILVIAYPITGLLFATLLQFEPNDHAFVATFAQFIGISYTLLAVGLIAVFFLEKGMNYPRSFKEFLKHKWSVG